MARLVKHARERFLSYATGRPFSKFNPAPQPALEPVYQHLFERDLKSLELADTFYPVGAAANYGLLYLVLRAAKSFSFQQVVELGAGQTTLLIDALRRNGTLKAGALTIEHDADWAAKLSATVEHRICRVGLVAAGDDHATYECYDFQSAPIPEMVDLLIIDGPPGGRPELRFARHGAVRLLDRLDPGGFIVIVDDAERLGEAALVERIDKYLRTNGIEFRRGIVTAAKCQSIFAAGRLLGAAFY
jgi:hypothetical protein